MNILRNLLIGLMSFVCITALSGFVYLLTLQTTIMDRMVVKNWLNESGIYDGKLLPAMLQADDSQTSQPEATAAITPSTDTIKTSLNATFTPEFTKTHIEQIIDSTYDWMEGKSPTLSFSVPIDEKRETFIQSLSRALEPQIAALPVCQSAAAAQAGTCRPPTMTVEQFASELTNQSINGTDIFAKPLTADSFAQNTTSNTQPLENSPLTQLPAISQMVELLVWLLPIIALASAAAVITMTSKGARILAGSKLLRRIFFSMLFILIPAALIAWIASSNNLSLSSLFPAQTGELFVPLMKTILVGILGQLALISAIAAAISATAWMSLVVLQRKISIPQPALAAPSIAAPPQQSIQPSDDHMSTSADTDKQP